MADAASTREVTPRAALAKAIPRRPRVTWWLGVLFAFGFALLVTPAITAERWLLSFGPGAVAEKTPAPFTVRAPLFAGYDAGDAHLGGGVVVARGEVPTRDQVAWADAIAATSPNGVARFAAYFVLAIVLASVATNHMRRSTRGRLVRVQLASLGAIAVVAIGVKVVLLASAASVLVVPVALFAMVPTLALDRIVGLATGILAALVVSSLAPFDGGVAILLMVQAATAGLVIAERPKRRWRAALVAGGVTTLFTAVTYALLTYLTTGHFPPIDDPLHAPWLAAAIGPAIATVLAVPLLPLYQLLVGEITEGRLIELEDLSNPLLKQIAEKAPGTWQHSLMMANLAEMAANAIGASGRLVRVGAYYHDLGKSLQPKYFIENLEPGETSPHDRLPPEVSCDAIFAHVTEGLVTARRARLHERVIDFMHMHHGNGVLEYFWAKCREQGNPQELTVEQFRYPGHPPQSRETAILAICDAVEAASRTLKKPDAAAIDSLVQRIVYGKLHLGQLDESGLSMSDLRRISDSLRETIRHANHGRIEYPWQKDEARSASEVALSGGPRLDSLDRPARRDASGRVAMDPGASAADATATTGAVTPAGSRAAGSGASAGSAADPDAALAATTSLRPAEPERVRDVPREVRDLSREARDVSREARDVPREARDLPRDAVRDELAILETAPALARGPEIPTTTRHAPPPPPMAPSPDAVRNPDRSPNPGPDASAHPGPDRRPAPGPDSVRGPNSGPDSPIPGPDNVRGPNSGQSDPDARERAAALPATPIGRKRPPTVPPTPLAGLLTGPRHGRPPTVPPPDGRATAVPMLPPEGRAIPAIPPIPPPAQAAPAARSTTTTDQADAPAALSGATHDAALIVSTPFTEGPSDARVPPRPTPNAPMQSAPRAAAPANAPMQSAPRAAAPSNAPIQSAPRAAASSNAPMQSAPRAATSPSAPAPTAAPSAAAFAPPPAPAAPAPAIAPRRAPTVPPPPGMRMPPPGAALPVAAAPPPPPAAPAPPPTAQHPEPPASPSARYAGPPMRPDLENAVTNPPPLRRSGHSAPPDLRADLDDVVARAPRTPSAPPATRLPALIVDDEPDPRVTAPRAAADEWVDGPSWPEDEDDPGVTQPSIPILQVGDMRSSRHVVSKDRWREGLAARIDQALDGDEWGPETPIVPPTKAELRALLGQPDPTRQVPLAEIERLQRASTAADSMELDLSPRRSHSPTTEVDPDDIEAQIEVAPPARRPPSAIAVAKPKKRE